MSRWLTWVLVLSLAASGCSIPVRSPERKPPPTSEALVIARAAGFQGIRDVDPQTLKSVLDAKAKKLQQVHAAGLASGQLRPTPGLPAGLEAALLFLDSLPKERLEDRSRLLAWMPRDLAPSPQAARTLLREIWTRAVQAALPEANVKLVDDSYEVKPLLAPRSIVHRWSISIDMPGCSKCSLTSQALQDSVLPKAGTSPPFLGSRAAWVWGGLSHGQSSFSGYPWSIDGDPDERLEYLVRVSTYLPAWAYLYLPYDERIAPYQQILHEGKALLFVQPGFEEPP